MPRGVYERAGAKPEPIHITYWDIVEAALTALPESYSAREEALRAFDHLKERMPDERNQHSTQELVRQVERAFVHGIKPENDAAREALDGLVEQLEASRSALAAADEFTAQLEEQLETADLAAWLLAVDFAPELKIVNPKILKDEYLDRARKKLSNPATRLRHEGRPRMPEKTTTHSMADDVAMLREMIRSSRPRNGSAEAHDAWDEAIDRAYATLDSLVEQVETLTNKTAASPPPQAHVEGCICPRFKDIAPDLIADLTCPVHGVNGTDPGDVIAERSPAIGS
jgi:hypothetical protein